ncbi:3949_t:CDS:1, partial [Acaulospora colombiana]
DRFKDEVTMMNNELGTVATYRMEMELWAYLYTLQKTIDLMDSNTKMSMEDNNETS